MHIRACICTGLHLYTYIYIWGPDRSGGAGAYKIGPGSPGRCNYHGFSGQRLDSNKCSWIFKDSEHFSGINRHLTYKEEPGTDTIL